MKTKFHVLGAALVLYLSFGVAQVESQYPGMGGGPGGQPAVSPWMNLLRPGDRALNYFGMVQPQQNFRSSIQGLNATVGAVQSQVILQEGQELALATGHTTNFMTQYKYFMTRGGPPRRGGMGQGGGFGGGGGGRSFQGGTPR